MKSLIEPYNKIFLQILQRKLLPVSISPGRFLMFEIGKKVVALVVDDDERREVLDVDLADSLHAQFGEVHDLDRLD